jgi:hypothetical protein
MTRRFITSSKWYLLKWLYSPCGPSPLVQFPDLFYSQSAGLLEWVISSSQGLYRNFWREMADNFAQRPLGAWGSLTCSKFTTWVKQLKVPPGGLVPWIFPSLKIRYMKYISPWRHRQELPAKLWYLCIKLHGIASCKTTILIFTPASTSNHKTTSFRPVFLKCCSGCKVWIWNVRMTKS